ncbi:very short patch repair endonuclease [Planococcus salinarum]|uniref:very short patch repair endonuclease n=1 Tax=Planococcus salinarum TaxID=622695 RepID=UPI000E3DB456|nr:very short patch repair endonuclease [Planococcus salinarum]TAA73145.1 very short patch repair endonuclease [Planococcus salinarum]
MAGIISSEGRKNIMKSIKSESKLENKISKLLWHKGYRYRKNVKNLVGKPDIAIKKYKIVIFIDSCFWHHCPDHGHFPRTNEEFWRKKLTRNMERDIEVNNYYNKNGWNILRIWEHETKNLEQVIGKIVNFIEEAKMK